MKANCSGDVYRTLILPSYNKCLDCQRWCSPGTCRGRKRDRRPYIWHYHQAVRTPGLTIFVPRLSVPRTASYKLLTLIGVLSSFTCYILLVLRWRGNTSFWESLYIGPGGFGTGIVQATTFVGLAAGVDEAQMAIASTGLYLSANIGGLVGISLASKVLQASLRTGLNARLAGFQDRQPVSASSPWPRVQPQSSC